jgi:ectoine hydroxylase-related dioxygenase (phytanoyl-CoA dioxygenase family)
MEIQRFSRTQSDDMRRYFDENGFVIITDALSSEDIADFRAEVKNVISAFLKKAGLPPISHEGDRIFTDGIHALEKADHEYVASIYDTIFQTPSFFRILGERNIETAIKDLLGIEPDHALYGFTNRCRIDPPSDNRRTYGWHQEVFYTVAQGKYLQTWAPLVFDTKVANGTIEICPGSHKEVIAKQSWDEIPGRATQILIDDAVIAKYDPTPVEMKLGELLIFSGYLAHRSGSNTSDQVRYSLVGMYHDVMHEPFKTPKLGFDYRGQSPRAFYDSVFKEAAE